MANNYREGALVEPRPEWLKRAAHRATEARGQKPKPERKAKEEKFSSFTRALHVAIERGHLKPSSLKYLGRMKQT